MIHNMRLHEKYFAAVKSGKKKYEVRLLDDKRKKIKKGDFIEFQNRNDSNEVFLIEVEDLLYFNNFKELVNSIDIKNITGIDISKEELEDDFNSFYSKEELDKHLIVAIKLKENSVIEEDNFSNVK